jgi:plastocyanin
MKRPSILITAGVALSLAVVSLLSVVAGPRTSERKIVLVARNMAFYLEGGAEANPVLRLGAGEQVRLVLRNEEPGVLHDFAVADWKIGTKKIRDGSDTIVFKVPTVPGRTEYVCNPHAQMMKGIIEIQ